MSYRRDFTIGLRETRRFYLMLVLEKWRKGLLGFGLGRLSAFERPGKLGLSRLLVKL